MKRGSVKTATFFMYFQKFCPPANKAPPAFCYNPVPNPQNPPPSDCQPTLI